MKILRLYIRVLALLGREARLGWALAAANVSLAAAQFIEPWLFGRVGDMMNWDDLPGVAEVAMQSGIHAARTIKRRLEGKEAQPFKYRDLGSMAAVSRRRAIVSFKGMHFSGFIGWIIWLLVHVTFMTGFKNRFKALISWLLSFVGSGRTERAITVEKISS